MLLTCIACTALLLLSTVAYLTIYNIYIFFFSSNHEFHLLLPHLFSVGTFGKYCSELEKEKEVLQVERLPRVIHAACGLKENWSTTDNDSGSYATAEIHIV